VGDDGAFFGKAFHVCGLTAQEAFGDQQRKIRVDVACFLEASIQVGAHRFPQRESVRAKHHAAAHRALIGQRRFAQHVLIPFVEIHIAWGDACFCHKKPRVSEHSRSGNS
jgi:hypothetical protein